MIFHKKNCMLLKLFIVEINVVNVLRTPPFSGGGSGARKPPPRRPPELPEPKKQPKTSQNYPKSQQNQKIINKVKINNI